MVFVEAADGKLVFSVSEGRGLERTTRVVGSAYTAAGAAAILEKYDGDDLYGSSSCDFGLEYGFESHSAPRDMLKQALEIIAEK